MLFDRHAESGSAHSELNKTADGLTDAPLISSSDSEAIIIYYANGYVTRSIIRITRRVTLGGTEEYRLASLKMHWNQYKFMRNL